MGALTAQQRRTRQRVETFIRLMAPALNLVLVAGERLSRIVDRGESDYYPPRSTGDPVPTPDAPPERE